MLRRKKASGNEREKGRSWDGENSSEKKEEKTRRPYKSMSFTASELASSQRNSHKKTHSGGGIGLPKPFKRASKYGKKVPQNYRKKIVVWDASTQTPNDASTQTEDVTSFETKVVELRRVQTSNVATESVDFRDDGSQADLSNASITPADLFTDLNDLESEIAKIRYKALSLKESMKWLDREKKSNLRPNCPVGEESETEEESEEPKFGFLPVKEALDVKTNAGKRTLSVPVFLSIPVPFDKSPNVTPGPDQSKFFRISESSVFFRITPNRTGQTRKHSKSMNDLPQSLETNRKTKKNATPVTESKVKRDL